MSVNSINANSLVSEATLHEVGLAVNQAIQGHPDGALARLTKKCALNGEQTDVIAHILSTFQSDFSTKGSESLKNRILAVLNHKTLEAASQSSALSKAQITPLNFNTICFTETPASEFANAYPCTFEFGGKYYPDAATCFLAQRSIGELLNKYDVMMHVQRAKFGQNPALKEKLIVTGNAYIVCQGRDSLWSDQFNGTGENQLGKCLMQLRGEYDCRGIVPASIRYNDMILSQKDRCFFLVNELHEDIIGEIFTQCFLTRDFRSLQTLACMNKNFNQIVMQIVNRLNLEEGCSGLRVIDATMQGSTVDDEPPINKLSVLRCIKDLSSHVEGEAGLTLLTMCKDRTLKDLIAIAKEVGIEVEINEEILEELGDLSVKQTYRVMITNNVFRESRNKLYVEQKDFVFRIGCEMPTLQEYVVLCVFTNKIFEQCLYGQTPLTYGRTSTQAGGYPLVVGGSAPARLDVSHGYDGGFFHESDGAGGRRK